MAAERARRALAGLAVRERECVELRARGLSQAGAAAELGISQAAVSRLERRAIRRLRGVVGGMSASAADADAHALTLAHPG
jgi:RNA polymerase sigma factor (sigma-70 family)